MARSDKRPDLQARLFERLHDPLQLRLFATGSMLLAGYLGIYMPLSGRIAELAPKLAQEQKRLSLARDIEHLRHQVDTYKDRLPDKTDTNEWVQYVLEGIRNFPLKLVALDPAAPRRAGPYKAVVLHIEIEGAFSDLDSFLHWLESNDRLMRVDAVKIEPARGERKTLVMQLTVLGVMG